MAGFSRQSFAYAFRALQHRNFRLFFMGQALSLIGTWLSRMAMGWLAYRLTDDPFKLGLVTFAGFAPTLILTPMGGIIADRGSRHRILIVTQAVLMVTSLALAFFTLTNTVDVAHLLVIATLQGMCNAFDVPARQAFVVEMVEGHEDLGGAIAINSMVFNSARTIGPALAGVLVGWYGEGSCFLIDGVSFFAVLAALLAMRIAPREPQTERTRVKHAMREGLVAAFGFPPIRAILILTAITSLIGMPYAVLMPVFARDVLHGTPSTYGILLAAAGIGALAGALVLAMRQSVLGLGRVIATGGIIAGLALMVFAKSTTMWIAVPALVVVGFAMMVQSASSNTVIQSLVDDKLRGRVMGFYAMAFLGAMPFGALLAGALAKYITAPTTVLYGGIIYVLAAATFAFSLRYLRKHIRPIYQERGILPREDTPTGATAFEQWPDTNPDNDA